MFYLGSVLCLHFFKPRLNNTVSTFVGIGCIEFKNYTHTHKVRLTWTTTMWRSRKSQCSGEGSEERSGGQMQHVFPPSGDVNGIK